MGAFGEEELKRFRNYLYFLARMQVEPRQRAKVDPSDIVQLTLLEAHQNQNDFRGATDAELMAWLRRILSHNIADAIKGLGRAKRNAAMERAVEASSCQLQLVAKQSSPSGRAIKEEAILSLVNALAELPDAQRQAVELHHLQGMSLKEVASRLDRSELAVAGLLHRGLAALRELLERRSV